MSQVESEETPFVKALRKEIYNRTGQEFDRTDPIYPILVCIQVVCRALFNETRKTDIEGFKDMAGEIRGVREAVSKLAAGAGAGQGDKAERVKRLLFGAFGLALGLVAGFAMARFL